MQCRSYGSMGQKTPRQAYYSVSRANLHTPHLLTLGHKTRDPT